MEKGIGSPQPFGTLPSGAAAELYQLESVDGLRLAVTNYGGAIVSLETPDREGRLGDVVLGYDDVNGYFSGKSYFGAIVGRYGNRIARGRFEIDGRVHQLPINNGVNSLHGGPEGFHRKTWEAAPERTASGPRVTFARVSRDGEEGYPGDCRVEVSYTLERGGALRIDYRAETDQPTPVNLTNHSYFNLAGQAAGSILDHELEVRSSHITAVDSGLIPTGELRPVESTPFDFRQPHRIGERIEADNAQLRLGPGYDHNFVLERGDPGALTLAARVYHAQSGRVLEVVTTEPALQFYSGNFLDGTEIGKGGVAYQFRGGFCLETQHFPDSPNHPEFPNTLLRPGQVYRSTTIYRFSAT